MARLLEMRASLTGRPRWPNKLADRRAPPVDFQGGPLPCSFLDRPWRPRAAVARLDGGSGSGSPGRPAAWPAGSRAARRTAARTAVAAGAQPGSGLDGGGHERSARRRLGHPGSSTASGSGGRSARRRLRLGQPRTAGSLACGVTGGEEDRGLDGGGRGRTAWQRPGRRRPRALGSTAARTVGDLAARRTAEVMRTNQGHYARHPPRREERYDADCGGVRCAVRLTRIKIFKPYFITH